MTAPTAERTPEMVEAVAQAIRKAGYGSERGWKFEVHEAIAAIQAMRKPPESVLGAIHDRVRIECRPGERSAYILNADEMWAAGIDAALAMPGEGRD